MKYFKPELLARCRSQDDNEADAAAQEWDSACEAYRDRLAAISATGQLPPDVVRLCSAFSLHDARLLGAAFGTEQSPLFGLLLRLEGPGKVLQLDYFPVPGPEGGVSVRPQGAPQKEVWVLYDEFDHDEARDFYTHSLLLSDGREIEVRFENFTVRILDDVLTPIQLPDGEKKWALTALNRPA